MPIHDWTRAGDGTFPDFHATWLIEIKRSLNGGVLPSSYYAMVEPHALGLVPDVLTRELPPAEAGANGAGVTAVAATPVRLQPAALADRPVSRNRRRAVTVRRTPGDRLVAVIEVVSPGNKDARAKLASFVRKGVELLDAGIHLVVIDLHPAGRFDPAGIHAALWRHFSKRRYEPPVGKPPTFASYEARPEGAAAYLFPAAAGDPLPQVPVFLHPGLCVELPLAPSYDAAFDAVPRPRRVPLEA